MVPKDNTRLMALISKKEEELSGWKQRVASCKESAHKLGVELSTEFPISQMNKLQRELEVLRSKL